MDHKIAQNVTYAGEEMALPDPLSNDFYNITNPYKINQLHYGIINVISNFWQQEQARLNKTITYYCPACNGTCIVTGRECNNTYSCPHCQTSFKPHDEDE